MKAGIVFVTVCLAQAQSYAGGERNALLNDLHTVSNGDPGRSMVALAECVQPLIASMDFDACVNLTNTLVEAGQLGMKGWNMSVDAYTKLVDSVNVLLNCSSLGITNEVQCFFDQFKFIKEEVEQDEVLVENYLNEAMGMYEVIKKEFKDCIQGEVSGQLETMVNLVQKCNLGIKR